MTSNDIDARIHRMLTIVAMTLVLYTISFSKVLRSLNTCLGRVKG